MADLNNKGLLVGAMLVTGLLVGGGVGYAAGNNNGDSKPNGNQQSTAARTDTKAADLRVALNSLEAQHVDLASTATRAGFDGSPMFEASAGALDENSVALSKAVGSVYGEEAEAKFLEIWRSHITFFVDYTVAAKTGDQAGMDKAVSNLNGYVSAISDLLGGATGLPKEAVAGLVSEHVGLLKTAVDKHGAGDYAGSYEAQQQARDQITNKIADTLAGAIVKQNPEKFNN
ncbi:hypothetical protein CYG49_01490 [Candidatus Saccharibacteria bacterium]|nr:MAG: hypothetical protein CYG49_01490 [Candidatus Saccharibacteria bacterium]